MWALYNNSIFERNQIYDFQASCVVVKHTVSAGIRSVFVVSTPSLSTILPGVISTAAVLTL